LYSGQVMPNFADWILENIQGVDFTKPAPQQEDMEIDPPKHVNHEFIRALESQNCFSRRSFEKWERIMHSHGASLKEVYALRYGRLERYVDLVLYPDSTDQV